MIALPSDAIKLLGGYQAVSERVSRPYTTVASWAARQSIPAAIWSSLIDLASEKQIEGLTYEALALAHTRAADMSAASQPDSAA